jgi:hypothetical protein
MSLQVTLAIFITPYRAPALGGLRPQTLHNDNSPRVSVSTEDSHVSGTV